LKKVGRNDKCPCGSGEKYKKCCFKKKIIFESPRNLKNILKFANTDITSLKSSVRPSKMVHSERKNNLDILKKICSNFKIDDGIGICNKSNLICRAWECNELKNCKNECVLNCPINNEGTIYISEVPKAYTSSIENCKKEMDLLVDTLEKEEVISYLTANLERCAAEALTTSPSELISIMIIRNWMFQKYGDLRKYNLNFKYTNEAELYKLWNYLIQIQILDENISMLKNGDAVLVFTPKGYEEFKESPKDPLYDIKNIIKKLKEYEKNPERAKEIFTRERCKSKFWTYKMKDVIKWCMHNNLHPEPGGEIFHKEYKKIITHVQSFNEDSKFDPTECLNLGWPLFITFFHTYRYCALKFPWLSKIIEFYRDTEFEASILEENGFSPWNWDNFIYKIPWPDNDPLERDLELYSTSPDIKIEQNNRWPLNNEKIILNLSKFIIGFGMKYYDDLFTDPRISGDWFEEVLSFDILMRKIPILEMSYDLPNDLGDIDILAFDAYWNYLIEAKDWGPRGKRSGYFSSTDYIRRLNELNEELNKLKNRINWLKNNRSMLKIPDNAGIMGLFITSFIEPHLKSPDEIISIPHTKLCAIFGGEAINPILTGRGHPKNLKFIEEIKKRNEKKNKDIKKKIVDQSDGEEKLIKEHILNRILDIFGGINAYHVYRTIYEITEAYKLKGVSIKEMSAEWIERPPILTKQYITFVLYRSDDLSLVEIKESVQILNKKGLIKSTHNMLILEKIPETEFWKLKDKKFIRIDNEDEANAIINVKHSATIPEGFTMVGMPPPLIKTSKGTSVIDFRYI